MWNDYNKIIDIGSKRKDIVTVSTQTPISFGKDGTDYKMAKNIKGDM